MAATSTIRDKSPLRRHDREVFYKYVSAEVAKIILTTRKLRWSSPLLFNDPFDVTQELRLNFDEAALAAGVTDRVAALIECGESDGEIQNPKLTYLMSIVGKLPADVRSDLANDLRNEDSSPTDGQLRAFSDIRSMWSEMVPSFRLLCLSEAKNITPMWNHYANSYKGVVLEFAVVDEVDSALLVAEPVTYQDEPPTIAELDEWVDRLIQRGGDSCWELFKALQYVKTTDWAYEKEWRVVSGARPGETGLFGDYGFNPKELAGIYFGHNCEPQDIHDLMGLRSYGFEHVRAYDSYIGDQPNRLSFREI